MRILQAANLALLVLFPVSWFAPLLRAGFLPLFGLDEISVISGLQSLWESDVTLALLVTFLAIFAPMMKVIGVSLVQFGLLVRFTMPILAWLGKMAMADVFLLSLYIVVIKGVGMARIEVAWGMYLFSACIIASIVIAVLTEKRLAAG